MQHTVFFLVFLLVSTSSIAFVFAAISKAGSSGRFTLWKDTSRVSWNSALRHCEGDGGWLAVDLSVETHNILVTVPGGGDAAWLGGTDKDVNGVWRWVTGPVGKEDSGRGRVFFTGTANNNPTCILQDCFWNSGEPNDWAPNGQPWLSESFLQVRGGNIEWNDLAATGDSLANVYQWFCEYPSDPETPLAEQYPYRLFSRAADGGVSWYEARQICTIYNSSLAIDVDQKSRMLLERLGQNIPTGEKAFLAGTDFTVRGKWRWTAGIVQSEDGNLGRLFYEKTGDACHQPFHSPCMWSTAEPIVATRPSFAALTKPRADSSDLEWVSLEYPEKANYFICEFAPPTYSSTISPTYTPPPTASRSFSTSKSAVPTRSATASLPPTRSPSSSIQPPPTPSISISPSLPLTSSRTLSNTVIPPPTPTKSFSQSGPTPSGSLPPTPTRTITLTLSNPSASNTWSLRESESQSVTITISDESPSVTDSLQDTFSQSLTLELSSTLTLSDTITVSQHTETQGVTESDTETTTISVSKSSSSTIASELTFVVDRTEVPYKDFRSGVTLIFTLTGAPMDPVQYATTYDISETGPNVEREVITNFSKSLFFTTTVEPEIEQAFQGNLDTLWRSDHMVVLGHQRIRVDFPSIGDYNSNADEKIVFQLSEEVTQVRGARKVPTTSITIKGPPAVLDPTTKTVADVSVTVGTVAGGVFSGVVAAQGARSRAMLELSVCFFEYNEPLDFIQSPTGVAITTDRTKYYLGAAVMNPVLLVGFAIFHLAAAKAYAIGSKTTLREGMSSVYMPNLLFIPVMLFMQDTISAAFVVIFHAESQTPQIVAGCTFVFWVGVWIAIFLRVWLLNAFFIIPISDVEIASRQQKKKKQRGKVRVVASSSKDTPADERSKKFHQKINATKTLILWFFLGNGDWADATAAKKLAEKEECRFEQHRQVVKVYRHELEYAKAKGKPLPVRPQHFQSAWRILDRKGDDVLEQFDSEHFDDDEDSSSSSSSSSDSEFDQKKRVVPPRGQPLTYAPTGQDLSMLLLPGPDNTATTAMQPTDSSQNNDDTTNNPDHLANVGFCDRYGTVFDSYRPGVTWFVVIDCLTIVITSVLMAIRPSGGACDPVAYGVTALIGCYLILLVICRPFFVPFRLFIYIGATCLQLISSIAASQDSMGNTGTTTALLAMFFVVFSTIVDILLTIFGLRRPKHGSKENDDDDDQNGRKKGFSIWSRGDRTHKDGDDEESGVGAATTQSGMNNPLLRGSSAAPSTSPMRSMRSKKTSKTNGSTSIPTTIAGGGGGGRGGGHSALLEVPTPVDPWARLRAELDNSNKKHHQHQQRIASSYHDRRAGGGSRAPSTAHHSRRSSHRSGDGDHYHRSSSHGSRRYHSDRSGRASSSHSHRSSRHHHADGRYNRKFDYGDYDSDGPSTIRPPSTSRGGSRGGSTRKTSPVPPSKVKNGGDRSWDDAFKTDRLERQRMDVL